MSTERDRIAAAINGNEYLKEVSKEVEAEAKAAGVVIVFGASDDLMEFRGAIHDEVDCYDGGTAYLTESGLLTNECEDENCPHFERMKAAARTIEAKFDPGDGHTWKYETTIPHATFEIVEDGEPYCRGIAFLLADAGLIAHGEQWAQGVRFAANQIEAALSAQPAEPGRACRKCAKALTGMCDSCAAQEFSQESTDAEREFFARDFYEDARAGKVSWPGQPAERQGEALVYVPGMWRCAKCEFTLLQSNLNAHTGTVTARDEPGDKCPNCASPLWRVTYKDAYAEVMCRFEEHITHPAAPVGVPDGMVLVPREPTPEMLEATRQHVASTLVNMSIRRTIYRAMLAAAPSAPQGVDRG